MAIISGGRLNIWNAVKKQFEVVHPETEVARITDFADGIVQKLALTSAMAAITELQKDSWFGKLLKMALTASGVKYSIAQNGYVCLGELFGGLIIQWGIVNSQEYISLPVTAAILRYVVSIWDSKASNHFITVTGDHTGYIQIISASGIETGTAFFIAITK